ncbi:Ig-like domain repeat protein [Pseudomonas granadensis]|uniref:Ig-like domain repeat protein n=1 Tax=Pseudomonas granadensis TaxID=1421430 RepID=A0ABX7GLC3_9PSED|nr:Ig-like domain repeat protein [Pseudomonas granadensis]QRK86221.1 Ig-like domain repeat protein [Pseudomonas granadensis]
MDTPTPALNSNDLPPLQIMESFPGGLLNPHAVRHNITLRIDYEWAREDVVTIHCAETSGFGSYTSPPIPIGGFARPFQTHIDTRLVTFNLGHTVVFTYTVYRGTAEFVSQALALYVAPINLFDLPRPFIRQADNDGQGIELPVSDLDEFTLRINAWLLGAREQYFWLTANGTNADDTDFEASYWRAPVNVVDEDFQCYGFFEQNFPAAPLQALKNGSVLTLKFMAGLQGSDEPSLAQAFAHRNYIIRTGSAVTPRILSVRDRDGEVADGANTRYANVTLSGSASGELTVLDGTTPIGTASPVDGNWTHGAPGLNPGPHAFTVRLADGSGSPSSPRRINVVLSDLSLRIVEAPDDTRLDPLNALTSLTAELVYDHLPTDMVSVTVTAADGTPPAGSHTTTPVAAGNTRPIRITLPVSLVAFSVGKTMEVTFSYTRGGAAPVPSLPLRLNVLPIALERLVAPVITQANGDILDLKDIQSGANLEFGVWPLIAVSQRLSCDFAGESDTGPHNLRMWTATVNMVHRAWITNGRFGPNVSVDYLRLLKHGSKLVIRFRVNLDQATDPNTQTVFQTREYTINATP